MKKQLTLEDITARELYKSASKTLKTILEESFGKDFFSDKLINRIKSIEDIYTELKQTMPTISNYFFLAEEDREQALYTQYQLDIRKCFNQGWKPNFTNYNEYKYYLWWENKKDPGWSLVAVGSYCYGSIHGAGFYFKNKEDAKYCAELFADIEKKTL